MKHKHIYNWIAETARLLPGAKFSSPRITYRDGKTRIRVVLDDCEQNFVISNHNHSPPATPQDVVDHFMQEGTTQPPCCDHEKELKRVWALHTEEEERRYEAEHERDKLLAKVRTEESLKLHYRSHAMSEAKLDLDEFERVAEAAEGAIAALGNPAAKPSRREFSDGIEATKKFSNTFDPPTVKLMIRDRRNWEELACKLSRNCGELQEERDQLKAELETSNKLLSEWCSVTEDNYEDMDWDDFEGRVEKLLGERAIP